MTHRHSLSLKDIIDRLTREPKSDTVTETLSNAITLINKPLVEQPMRKKQKRLLISSASALHRLAVRRGPAWPSMILIEGTSKIDGTAICWAMMDRIFLTSAAQ